MKLSLYYQFKYSFTTDKLLLTSMKGWNLICLYESGFCSDIKPDLETKDRKTSDDLITELLEVLFIQSKRSKTSQRRKELSAKIAVALASILHTFPLFTVLFWNQLALLSHSVRTFMYDVQYI